MKNRTPALLLLAMCLLAGCSSDPTGGRLGSESHWLGSCEVTSECAEGLSCLCGVCTMACDRDDVCQAQDSASSCAPVDALARGCARPPAAAVCWSDAAGPWMLAEPDMTPVSDMTAPPGPPDVLTTHFVTTWDTSKFVGVDSDRLVEIGVGDGVFDYDVDWDNDGVFEQLGLTESVTHRYDVPGVYTVRIRGAFPHFQCNANTGNQNCSKLVSVDQWGDIEWGSMARAFEGATNLESLPVDTPDLSRVESLFRMFSLAPRVDGQIGGWDTSNVTDMSFMFNGAGSFNQPVGAWDTGKVTTMLGLFHNARVFNQPLDQWDTSQVTTMNLMFRGARAFDQPIGGWETSQVTDMSYMFFEADLFNQPVGAWDMSRVTTVQAMFLSARAFDQDLSRWQMTWVEVASQMLDQSGMSRASYDATLLGWASQDGMMRGVLVGSQGLEYCDATDARLALQRDREWVFSGDTRACD